MAVAYRIVSELNQCTRNELKEQISIRVAMLKRPDNSDVLWGELNAINVILYKQESLEKLLLRGNTA